MDAIPLLRPAFLLLAAMLAGCATQAPRAPSRSPAEVRAEVVRLLPANVTDKDGWATDVTAALSALQVDPIPRRVCATLAVIGQESGFTVDPVVPNLGRIARAEIDRRAAARHVPQMVVRTALAMKSTDGRSYAERIAAVRTERELSLVYEDLIERIPLGQRLFADSNPVRTGGPMQVSIAFAERHARENGYPYAIDQSIRREVFTRRGGVYFGIAHLLAYPVSYDRMIYRFADFNAGMYASRNAAFQNALSVASGIPLQRDGDLISYDSDTPGATEMATRALKAQIGMDDRRIRRELERGNTFDFERSALHARVFALAEKHSGKTLPRAMLPGIDLKSPKITRKLTTAWFAERVEQRYRACLAKLPASDQSMRSAPPM